MKANIHPQWQECTVTCACGNSFVTGATTPTMQVDICNKCHPFFTGEQRFVDKEGRLEKFQKKMADSKVRREQEAKRLAAKKARREAAKVIRASEPTSAKQVLNKAKSAMEAAEKAAVAEAKQAESKS
ncbi:50S ribosomal protein L31 [bacterium]|nr:50S ribosomal protein L31 [bacterium]